jgi:hypothetical protein
MTRSSRCARVVLIGCVALSGCPPPPPPPPAGSDMTPPGFGYVRVVEESATLPTNPDESDIMAQSVTKTLGANHLIRVVALAGDQESGIKDLAVVSDFGFRCYFGPHSETIGVLERAPLTFTPAITPASRPYTTPRAINLVANPMSVVYCGDRGPEGQGAVGMEGYVRVVATNGEGQTATSPTFVFKYRDIGGAR